MKMDVPVKNIITSSMGRKNDIAFKSYVWTQFTDGICRSSLIKPIKGVMMEDSDAEE